jgi:magnesium-transporting ATPase (P-type)
MMRAVQTLPEKSEQASTKGDIASTEETLASLHANAETGLLHADVETRRRTEGFNEVAEKRAHPILMFVGKFWGISAWMLKLIMVLSAALGAVPTLRRICR